MRETILGIAAGAALIGGIVAWQLLHTSYKSDIVTICTSEKTSGIKNSDDQKKLNDWISSHLGTPEGNMYFNELTQKGMADRAKQLGETARGMGINDCPLIDSYAALEAQIEYQRDLMTLCASDGDMPGLKYDDQATRNQRLSDWFASKSKTARMKETGTKLLATPQPDRGEFLRTEANANSVYQCDLASFIGEEPVARPQTGGSVELSPPQVNGDLTVSETMAAIQKALPDMEACYADAVAKDPKTNGRLLVDISLGPKGQVKGIKDEGGVFNKDLATCVHQVLGKVTYPTTTSGLSVVRLPIKFLPKNEDPNAPPQGDAGAPPPR
jgi:hypothetical protein